MPRALLLFVALLFIAPATASEVSYRRVTSKKAEAAFYRSGGQSRKNHRVHLHIKASLLHRKPSKVLTTRHGGRIYLFKNRSVPLVVNPANIYFRKILQRTQGRDIVCVRGTVRRQPFGPPGRLAVYVKTFKKKP